MSVLLLLASLISTPDLGPLNDVLMRRYPERALQDGASAGVVVSLWIDPEGRIYQCELVTGVGDKLLANQVCRRIEGTRVIPAMGRSGANAYANVVTYVVLSLPGTEQGDEVAAFTMAPDLSLDLNRLPKGLASPHDVTLFLEVDSGGGVSACEGGADEVAALARLGCDQIAGETFPSGADADGSAVPYVRSVTIRYFADNAQD